MRRVLKEVNNLAFVGESCRPSVRRPFVKPLIYGYMRVPQDASDDDTRQVEFALRTFAENTGYRFVKLFHEYDEDSRPVFSELVDELKQAAVYHVVLPSAADLAVHPALRTSRLAHLEQAANAHVHTLGDF
jgi:DNA invertase Pin-like site-specific DNA recombinase